MMSDILPDVRCLLSKQGRGRVGEWEGEWVGERVGGRVVEEEREMGGGGYLLRKRARGECCGYKEGI